MSGSMALAPLAAFQAGAAAAALLFVYWHARADWSINPARQEQAPAVGLAGAVSALLLALLEFTPLWPSWAVLGVSAAVFVGLPAVRACEWAAAWGVIRSRIKRGAA